MLLDCGTGSMMGCGINHGHLALLLIALGVGAMVKYKAIKATSCQTFGKIVGMLIMIIAVLGIVCSFKCAYMMRKCHDKPGCHDCGDKDKDGETEKAEPAKK